MEPIKVGLVDVGIRYGLSEIIAEVVELYNAGSINHIFLFGKNYSQINAVRSVLAGYGIPSEMIIANQLDLALYVRDYKYGVGSIKIITNWLNYGRAVWNFWNLPKWVSLIISVHFVVFLGLPEKKTGG